jgi:hypothetical protein
MVSADHGALAEPALKVDFLYLTVSDSRSFAENLKL